MRLQAYVYLGWSPILAVAADGARRVLQVVGWEGGTGTAPATGLYVGASGYVALIADGVDISGGSGAGIGIQVGTNVISAGTVNFSNSNGVTFGISGSTITASFSNGGAGGAAISGGTNSQNTGTVNFSNSNGISFGLNTNGVMTATVATNYQSQGNYLTTAMLSNAATISNIRLSAGTLSTYRSDISFNNGNGVSFGLETNGIITASVAAAGGAQTGISGISGGTTQMTSGTASFADGNGVTFGVNGNTITASVETNYQSTGNYLTTARASNDAIGLNSALTANGVSVTANSSGLSLNFPAFLTTAQPVGAYLTTADLSQNSSKYIQEWALTGNTAGTTSSAQGTRLYLSGGNNLTISGSSNSLVFSVGNYITTAMASNRGSDFVQATAAFAGTNANGTIASDGISVSVAAQSNQNISFYALGNTTQNSSTVLNASVVSYNGLGNMTVGFSNGSVQLSGGAGGNGLGGLSNSQTMFTSGTVILSEGGGAITIASTTGQKFNFSVPQTSSLSATGAQSISVNGSTVSIGVPYWTLSDSATSISLQRLAFTNSNNMTMTLSTTTGGSATLIGSYNFNVSAGTTSNNLNAVTFANSNNATFGLNGSTVTVSSPVSFSAGTTNQNLTNIVFSNSNGVSFGLNGSTVTASVQGVTYSRYNEFKESPMVAGNIGQASLHIQPWLIPNLHMDRIVVHKIFSNASNSSGSFTFSDWVGIYTQNANTLSLLHSASYSTNFSGSGTVGSYLSYGGGIKAVTMGLTQTLTDGMYWIGIINRTTTGGAAGHTLNQALNSNVNTSYFGIMGAATNATQQMSLGLGVWTVTTSGMPNSVAFTDIQGNSSVFLRPPSVYFVSGTI